MKKILVNLIMPILALSAAYPQPALSESNPRPGAPEVKRKDSSPRSVTVMRVEGEGCEMGRVNEDNLPIRLRYGHRYKFNQNFINTTGSDVGINTVETCFNEQGDFNDGDNPIFPYAQELIDRKFILKPLEKSLVVVNDHFYNVNHYPEKRVSNAITIVYKTKFFVKDGERWGAAARTLTTRQPYEITWCGDGVIDNYCSAIVGDGCIKEECDPGLPEFAGRCEPSTCKLKN